MLFASGTDEELATRDGDLAVGFGGGVAFAEEVRDLLAAFMALPRVSLSYARPLRRA